MDREGKNSEVDGYVRRSQGTIQGEGLAMSQSYEYMKHCARCAAIGAEPLTYLQFISLLDSVL